MKTVHKYEVAIDDEVVFNVPVGAELLSVGSQTPRKICFWMLVNTDEPMIEHKFRIRGTGHPCDDVGKFVGTVTAEQFVWHVFK